jgi:hypothetical protein
MGAKYCIKCEEIRVKFKQGGLLKKDETVLEYLSGGEVAHTQTLPYLVTDTLTIPTVCFVEVEKPKEYTVEDLVQMIADKKR